MKTKHLNGIDGKLYYRYDGGYVVDSNDPDLKVVKNVCIELHKYMRKISPINKNN